MLQRQARNAVGWFQQLMDSKWFNNIWIFNDSWVVPLKGFRFRGNYCSHLFTPSPRLPTHPKPGVVTMTEPFVRWETGITWNDPRVWSKSLAVLLTATPLEICENRMFTVPYKMVPANCQTCCSPQTTCIVGAWAEWAQESKGSNRFNSDSAMTQAILSKTPDWHLYIRTLQTNLNSIQSKVALRVAGFAQRAARSVQMSEITCEAATQNKQVDQAGKK